MSELQAIGTFEVKMAPIDTADPGIGGMTLAKTYAGDLHAEAVGQMLAMRTTDGSAGYVAMERVTGSLAGRSGSFALQHSGLMDRGTPSLTVTIVPDSGTDDLAGLAGSMEIKVEAGRHEYVLRYSFP